MGKVIRDGASGGPSDDERRKTAREERKARAKKKKRKGDLTDLHQRLHKSRKVVQEKETKIDGKSGKPRNPRKTSSRILPRACAGIYRNGAAGKEIRRPEGDVPLNDLNNARLDGNVLKLLHGYDSKSESVVIGNGDVEVPKDPLLDSTLRNILRPTPSGEECASPVLGRVDGKNKLQRNNDEFVHIEAPQRYLEEKKPMNSDNLAFSKYGELCKFISTEGFEGQHLMDQFTTDPLTMVKRKLRSMYAESFRSQFLRDMIKRGTILNDCETPGTSADSLLPSEFLFCPSGYTAAANLEPATAKNQRYHVSHREEKAEDLHGSRNRFLTNKSNLIVEGNRQVVPSSNLLFDIATLNSCSVGFKNAAGQEVSKRLEGKATEGNSADNYSTVEVNHSTTSKCSFSNAKYIETHTEGIERKNKSAFFLPMDVGLQNSLTNKRHMARRKNQRTQTIHLINSGPKKHVGRQNPKMPQQVKMKNLKHIPAILRRCGDPAVDNNSRLNLFQDSRHVNKESRETFDAAAKQNVLFSPDTLAARLDENPRRLQSSHSNEAAKDFDVHTCVMASPSLRNDNACFLERTRSQHRLEAKKQEQNPQRKDIFVKKNPSIQKTIMFTRKDSRNIEHCLHLNNLTTNGAASNSKICVIKRNVPLQKEKSMSTSFTVHNNCCRAFHCSQESVRLSQECQEYNEVPQPQKPVFCEKLLVRKVQQHPTCESNQTYSGDKRVYYVVVDQNKDSSSGRECRTDNVSQVEKSRTVQGGHLCQDDVADVGILKGVQNLKILPAEKREAQVNSMNTQCIENAVVLEEQPIKYLAFDNDSKTQKVPIYVQKNKHVATVDNVEIIKPNANYRVVSCPQESAQKIIFVPACERNNVVYVKPQNCSNPRISFEECAHPRKMLLYRPQVQCVQCNSNVCDIHAAKQNVMEIRRNDCDAVVSNLQQADGVRKLTRRGVDWEELHYRPQHEHSMLNGTCARSQTIYYQK